MAANRKASHGQDLHRGHQAICGLDAGELLEMPSPAHRKAEFLIAIVDAVTRAYPRVGHDIGLRCRKPRSKATILASLQSLDEKITGRCPIC